MSSTGTDLAKADDDDGPDDADNTNSEDTEDIVM